MSSRAPAWQPPQRYIDAGYRWRHNNRWSGRQTREHQHFCGM